MNKKQCREALDIYKKFVVRMDNVAKCLRTAEVTTCVAVDARLDNPKAASLPCCYAGCHGPPLPDNPSATPQPSYRL